MMLHSNAVDGLMSWVIVRIKKIKKKEVTLKTKTG